MKKFSFSDIQATAILEMRLNKLAWLERQKIEDELNEKLILIADLLDILAKPERINSIIDTEFDEALEVFGDERRTKVNAAKVWEFNPKDTIPNEEVMIAFSKKSYIKRVKPTAFRTQRRGGKWISTWTKEDDEIMLMVPTMNHSDLLFFTTKWRVFNLPAYEIPETSRTAKWQPVVNLLNLQKGEEIAAILDITRAENKFLFFVSKNWIVKKLDMEEVRKIRQSWLKVVWVKEWDDLMWVKTTSWNDNIFLATHNWKAIQFNESDVRPMGRWAAWVKWINLKEGDEVIEVAIVSEDVEYVFTVTETGMWKITWIEEYKNQKRWGSGVKAMVINDKTWKLVSCKILTWEDKKELEVILISKWGQTIRMNLGWIRKTSRVTQWVILTKLKQKNDIVVRASLIKQWDEEEENK
jgi:DNA gyrase subunit A